MAFCRFLTRVSKPLSRHYSTTPFVQESYELAKKKYKELGINTDEVINKALSVGISLHCWQADDVRGFEVLPDGLDGGGIMATGNYPGRARNADETRQDIAKAISLIPGSQRVNLHASYADSDGKVIERTDLKPEHFSKWVQWAKAHNVSLDFNPTYFAHPKANDGWTLSHPDKSIRDYWIEHGLACRKIAQYMGNEQGNPCVVNWWVPDGCKDMPADRFSYRKRLAESYDEIFHSKHGIDTKKVHDYVESKLFGLASEEYVVGSAEFYSHYAASRKVGLTMDMGHYHPTESVADKISSHLTYLPNLLLHVSRPIRWDSDHVVIMNDDVTRLMLEIQRGKAWDKVTIALDFFDASINRVGAYVIGTRATRKAILFAMLEPTELLQEVERKNNGTHRLALMEEFKSLPWTSVWDMLCSKANVPVGPQWLDVLDSYHQSVQSQRK